MPLKLAFKFTPLTPSAAPSSSPLDHWTAIPVVVSKWSISSFVHTWFCVHSQPSWRAVVARLTAPLVVLGLGFGGGPAPEPVHPSRRHPPYTSAVDDLAQQAGLAARPRPLSHHTIPTCKHET